MRLTLRARRRGALFPLSAIVACLALSVLGCRCSTNPPQRQPSPAAAATAEVAPAPQPEMSTITLPIRLDLNSLSPEIEARVEKTFNGTASERGIDIDYRVTRDPIRLRMIGAGLHASTTVRYAMQACRGRFPCVSCGFAEARREAEITLHTKLEWDPAWRLRSSTTLLPVHYPKPCEVTWFGLDITRRFVAPVVERQLGAAARIIDRNTPAVTNIRPQAEQIWTSLQTPFELAPRTWLVMEPVDVALTPITGAGTIATSTLSLRALTKVVVGDRPAAARKPLPPLRVAPPPGDGVRIPLDLELPYDEASRLASREYAGRTYSVDGKPLTIESLRLAPAAGGRIALEAMIDYRGGVLRNYRGIVHLQGTPQFDPATSMLFVPDLDYALDPNRRGFFTRVVEQAAHESIRQRLRESARLPLAGRIAEIRSEISRALTRPLAPGVTLRGTAQEIEPVAVHPGARTITIRIIATGNAAVEIR